jgi:fluoride exporter
MTVSIPPLTASLLVAIGGGIGALCRYWLGQWTLATLGNGWPWGTLMANVAGGLAMGLIVEWAALRGGIGPQLKLLLTVGVLGGFTTFSAFSLEAAQMIERGDLGQAAGYALVSVVASIAALFAGMMLVRTLT